MEMVLFARSLSTVIPSIYEVGTCLVELMPPGMTGLHCSIERAEEMTEEMTDVVLLALNHKSFGLSHVDLLFHSVIQELRSQSRFARAPDRTIRQ